MQWRAAFSASYTRDIALGLVVCLPILWLLGHLPMWWRTLVHWSLEQVDGIILGGGGSKSLAGALTRFCMTLVALFCCMLAAGLWTSPISVSNTRQGVFQFVCVFFTFLIARCPADPRLIHVAGQMMWTKRDNPTQAVPPAAHFLAQRFVSDPVRAFLSGLCFFILHATAAIEWTQDHLASVVFALTICLGFIRHHVLHQLGQPYPWLALKGPLLRGKCELRRKHAHLFALADVIEHDVLYPLVIAYGIQSGSESVLQRFGNSAGSTILSVACFKLLRLGYSDTTRLWLSLAIAWLSANFDSADLSEGILLDTFVVHTVVMKADEFLRKLGFAFVYNVPGNYRAMSAFHAIMFVLPLSPPGISLLTSRISVS